VDAYAGIHFFYAHKTNKPSKSLGHKKHILKANVAFCLQIVIK
jgi:hypothetical protein